MNDAEEYDVAVGLPRASCLRKTSATRANELPGRGPTEDGGVTVFYALAIEKTGKSWTHRSPGDSEFIAAYQEPRWPKRRYYYFLSAHYSETDASAWSPRQLESGSEPGTHPRVWVELETRKLRFAGCM